MAGSVCWQVSFAIGFRQLRRQIPDFHVRTEFRQLTS